MKGNFEQLGSICTIIQATTVMFLVVNAISQSYCEK